MSEDNSKASPDSSHQSAAAKPQASRAYAGLGLGLALIAILATSFNLWQSFKDQKSAQAQLAKINELNSITRINSTRLSLLQQQNRDLQVTLATFRQQNNTIRVVLNEAADWIRAAQMSQLMNNTRNAIQYLQLAEQVLGTSNNAQAQAIRTAIYQDISHLKNSPTTTPGDLIIKLDALNQSIFELPTVFSPEDNQGKPSSSNTTENPYETIHWKERLLNTLAYLKTFVVIRHDSELPVLTPEQQNLIKMIVQFKLMETQWAVMQLQDSVYQHNLNLIAEFIQTYFMHSTGAAAIVNQIKELEQTHLQSPSLNLNQSLEMIEAALKALPAENPISSPSDVDSNSANGESAKPKADTTPPTHQSVEA